MSELIENKNRRRNFRWQLLASVSAFALIGSISTAARADDDVSKPLVWIELGGQFSRLDDGQETFAPPLMDSRPSIFVPSQKLDGPPRFSIDEEAKLSFQPDNSDWIFSGSVRIGRSANKKHAHQQTNPHAFIKYYYTTNASYAGGVPHRHKNKNVNTPQNAKFSDTLVDNGDQHLIADFQAGKDVGLGMFGRNGSSVFNFGVRFAQFSAKSNVALKSNPDWKFHYKYITAAKNYGFTSTKFATGQVYHSNAASLVATRQFHGIGPSLSWNASAAILGAEQDGEVIFDWGVNAAVLFGRQRAEVHHQSTGRYHAPSSPARHRVVTHSPVPVNVTRARTAIVPNVGGFAGLSFQVQNFKVSAGYRADLFFGAMDGEIDAAKKENVGFYGPFANISIGIGG